MEMTPPAFAAKSWPVASLYDLIVVGGGPAGTAAAISASRSGAKVLLLERGRLPRQRVCGEFVSAESLELLSELLAETAPGLLADSVRITSARLIVDGSTISTPVDPPAASIARFDLDAALWEAATKAGVHGRLQATVDGIERGDRFVVRSAAGIFQSRAMILAAGRWSNLDSRARVDEHSSEQWLGIKAHFGEQAPAASVDLYFFEGGYCGVQPVRLAPGTDRRGRVNACAMVRAEVARNLPEVFRLHPELDERARGWQPRTESVTTFPLVFRKPCPVEERMLRVGDAAGFVDPFVGDGISLALRSGALAAECLAAFFRAEISLAEAAANYSHLYKSRLLPVFRSSSKIRRLLSLPRPIRRAATHLLEKTPAMSRLLVRLTR